jgi:hypothetical protein
MTSNIGAEVKAAGRGRQKIFQRSGIGVIASA